MPDTKRKQKSETTTARRSERYGTLIKGWQWRTLPSLLEQMEQARQRLGLTQTEFMEQAARELIARTEKASRSQA